MTGAKMAQNKSYYSITYDIADVKRLAKIAKIMVNYTQRVLYRVLEGELTPEQEKQVKEKVAKVMELMEDSVIYFKLCTECVAKITSSGKKIPVQTDQAFIVV
ncbi:MAG: CRISPR-associated endonuclease Cas2 [Deltaproteobacteria bacterium]